MKFGIIAFLSTVVGAIVGVGGGLIIRPMLGFFDVTKGLASFSSAACVFCMGIVSLITTVKKGAKIQLRETVVLAAGSICGAFAGGACIRFVSGEFIKIGYIFAMVFVLACMAARSRLPRIKLKNPLLQFLTGTVTGGLSGFFGIGGGPFQMTALLLLFDLPPKEAAVQSIFITLLTTASSLIQYAVSGYWDFSLAVYMIPMAVIGGFIGGLLNRKFNNKYVSILFNATVLFIIIM
ncbi:MAG: sulfite exporter TauE/SafE family protein, partial [Oscillospiraceae bacterium]|nr:sulfite exporter TauE/SafE family protein [Oscillospiraceae bacterium]